MKILNSTTWLFLMMLTVTTAIISDKHFAAFYVMIISVIKMLIVAFQYMELKSAHLFWKIALTSIILLIASITILLLK